MRILWFTWKDGSHPLAGGAERVNEDLAARLVRDGHAVTFVTSGFRGAATEETRDGYRILRVGNRLTVYAAAALLYRRRLAGTADAVIDEMNTLPFFCARYVREKTFMFVHQLAREIWFYEMPFPLGLIGYVLEPLYLRLLSGQRAVTVSESSLEDLARYGFRRDRVTVIPQSLALAAADDSALTQKPALPTLLAFGSVRAMKRTLHAVAAFSIAKAQVPDLQLVIAGDMSGRYGRKVRRAVESSPYRDSVRLLGKVDESRKAAVLRDAHLLLATSVKEGWCLAVSEAAGQGTPAVAYDVDGLRDSVRDGETGVLVPSGKVEQLASAAVALLGDRARYESLRARGRQWAATLTPEASYASFLTFLTTL